MIHDRLVGQEMGKEQWTDVMGAVERKYNNTVHSTTRMKPNEAHEDKNNLEARLNMMNKAKFTRTYPPLKKGDKVRLAVKKKDFSKGTAPKWSEEVYTVLFDNKDGRYIIDTQAKRPYMRHELRRIETDD